MLTYTINVALTYENCDPSNPKVEKIVKFLDYLVDNLPEVSKKWAKSQSYFDVT